MAPPGRNVMPSDASGEVLSRSLALARGLHRLMRAVTADSRGPSLALEGPRPNGTERACRNANDDSKAR
jgi:hypothetical protein